MRILAIEASARACSTAYLDNGILRAEQFVNGAMTHSETLMPMIEKVMGDAGAKPQDMELIAVTTGPGSFTGLRIGAATAKGLAYGLQIPIMMVSTLEALAYNAIGFQGYLVPIMDARRSQVYTAVYKASGMQLECEMAPEAMAPSALCDWLKEKEEPVLFLGDAVSVYASQLKQQLGDMAIMAPTHLCQLRAASVGALAEWKLQCGEKPVVSDEVRLEYLRKPQAEREREARLQKEANHG